MHVTAEVPRSLQPTTNRMNLSRIHLGRMVDELERMAASTAMRRDTDEDLATVTGSLELYCKGTAVLDPDSYNYESDKFPEIVCAASYNFFPIGECTSVRRKLKMNWRRQLRVSNRLGGSFAERVTLTASVARDAPQTQSQCDLT